MKRCLFYTMTVVLGFVCITESRAQSTDSKSSGNSFSLEEFNESKQHSVLKVTDNSDKDVKNTNGTSVNNQATGTDGKVYDVVDIMPSFPGGTSALFEYLSQNVHYPAECEKNGITGRVICSFIVNADGSISDVIVVKSVDPLLDQESKRVISNMPKWSPGMQKGSPVRVKYTVPITYKL